MSQPKQHRPGTINGRGGEVLATALRCSCSPDESGGEALVSGLRSNYSTLNVRGGEALVSALSAGRSCHSNTTTQWTVLCQDLGWIRWGWNHHPTSPHPPTHPLQPNPTQLNPRQPSNPSSLFLSTFSFSNVRVQGSPPPDKRQIRRVTSLPGAEPTSVLLY